MLVNFVAATLEVIPSTGKTFALTLRSIDPITVDGIVADTVNDGRYNVRLNPGASAWLKSRLDAANAEAEAGTLSDGSVAFLSAVNAGSITLPDFKQGKRAARGASILSILPTLSAGDDPDTDTDTGDQSDGEVTPEADAAPDTTPTVKGRQKRS